MNSAFHAHHYPPGARNSHRAWLAATGLTLICMLTLAFASAAVKANAPPTARQGAPATGQWHVVPPVTNAILHDVHMVSSTLGWAVGDAGTVLQYDGANWHKVSISTTDDLIDVFMLTPTNGYIVGRGQSGGQIFHYNGTSWPLEYSAPSELTRLNASSATNVWSVGLNISVHWDGAQWTVVPLPVQRQLFAVQVLADNDVWATGQYEPVSNSGLILHYTNGQWTQVFSPSPQSLFDCFFTAPNDGWTVGYDVDIYHYNGVQWSFAYANTFMLSRLYMFSATDGWGISEVTNDIAHFDGAGWTQFNNPEPPGAYPISIYMVSPSDGWIVGGAGLMLHYLDTSTPTPSPSPTQQVTNTPTPCPVLFTDVQPADYFYQAVRYLYCEGAISGYADNTFRPYNNTTRGQLSKIVANAEGWPIDTQGGPHFTDVPSGSTFYPYIETAYNRGVISGYNCGAGCLEFRPGNNITRAQLSKIVVNAEGWPIDTQGGPHFTDVPPSDPFYGFIETAYNHTVISGYADSTFRPGSNATRGQISKIVYNAVTAP